MFGSCLDLLKFSLVISKKQLNNLKKHYQVCWRGTEETVTDVFASMIISLIQFWGFLSSNRFLHNFEEVLQVVSSGHPRPQRHDRSDVIQLVQNENATCSGLERKCRLKTNKSTKPKISSLSCTELLGIKFFLFTLR